MAKKASKKPTNQLREIVLLAELEDGRCYQVLLSELQNSAVRSVLMALKEPVRILENPLEGISLEQPDGN